MQYIHSGELTLSDIADYITAHEDMASVRYKRLHDYYAGKRRIDKGAVRDGWADNRLNTNLAMYITDTATGYFIGIPPVYQYSGENAETLQQALSEVLDASDETTVNYDIAEDMSIYGVGYDLVYISSAKEIRITAVDPRQAFVIADDTTEHRKLAGVRYWDVKERGIRCTVGEIYYARHTQMFRRTGAAITVTDDIPTPFSAPNLTEYPNNRHCIGDFEPVLSNIDGYNLALSNSADDLQNTANAYLVLSGFEQPDAEEMEVLKRERVIGLPSDGGAAYITKNLSDTAMENHKKTLKQDIMQVAKVPDLSDESFSGNASGVALKYKLWGIDQLFARKRSAFDRALFRRLRLIADALVITRNMQVEDIEKMITVKFTQNMPKDVSTALDDAIKASSVVSKQTVREMVEPITGVTAADEAARAEADAVGADYMDIAEPTPATSKRKTAKKE